jgi:hypothetical protein
MIWLDTLIPTIVIAIAVCLTIEILDRRNKAKKKHARELAKEIAKATAQDLLKKHWCKVRLEKWTKIAKGFNEPVKVTFT